MPGHLKDVHRAVGQILAATANDHLRALIMPARMCRERLHRIVHLAAAIHDSGLANVQFQAMIRSQLPPAKRSRQRLRHEWVTLMLLVRHEELAGWLRRGVNDVRKWQAVRWCVAGYALPVEVQEVSRDKLLAALLTFLQEVGGVPMLLMTASRRLGAKAGSRWRRFGAAASRKRLARRRPGDGRREAKAEGVEAEASRQAGRSDIADAAPERPRHDTPAPRRPRRPGDDAAGDGAAAPAGAAGGA
jgi:hypothetical protein